MLRFCGGLILDIKRKLPFFASDFYDAIHIQSLSAILFIYLGTVTNAITFGGLLGDATENMQVSLFLFSLLKTEAFERSKTAEVNVSNGKDLTVSRFSTLIT